MNDKQPNDLSNERSSQQAQPYYPTYMNAPYPEDEINLVDVWISLARYKRLFWSVFLVLLMVGSSVVLFVFNEKYMLTSTVQIGSIHNGSVAVAIETPEALKSKLNDALVPAVTSQWLLDYPNFKSFKTTVSNAKGSDVMLIQHKIKQSEVESFSKIQNLITATIINGHMQKVYLHQTGLRSALDSANEKLDELKDVENLSFVVDKKKLSITAGINKLERLEANYQLAFKGGPKSLLQSLAIKDRELLTTRDGVVIDELLKIRFDKFLLNNKMAQDEQKTKVENNRINLREIKKKFDTDIIRQTLEVKKIRDKMDSYDITRLVSAPVVSTEVTGLSRKLLLILVVFLAGFAGFSVVLMAIFRDKVKEKKLEAK